MSLLTVKNVSFGYDDKNVLDKINFDLYGGEHMGIVGKNGAGKSTLLKLLIGELLPDSGTINRNIGTNLGYLDQYLKGEERTVDDCLRSAFAHLYEKESKMLELYESGSAGDSSNIARAASIGDFLVNEGFYDIDSKINKIYTGLGMTSIPRCKKLEELSGGQRVKVFLAKLLLEKPDLIILDEPTNYLDVQHIEFLSEFLKSYSGGLIVVSHDFKFLDRVTNCILCVEHSKVKKYSGNFSAFLKQSKESAAEYEKRYKAQQKTIAKTEEFIRRNIAGVNTKMAQGRRTMLSKMERLERPKKSPPPHFVFKNSPLNLVNVLSLSDLEVGYSSPLFKIASLKLKRGEKLAITGFNGIGKTTLIKTILGLLPPLGGFVKLEESVEVLYFEQDLFWEIPELSPIEYFQYSFSNLTLKEIRSKLSACGLSTDLHTKEVKTLSGGEQTKLKLALLMMKKGNFLILDEPTNHLDQEAKEALMQAVSAFTGSAIIVSHDQEFLAGTADAVLDLKKDKKFSYNDIVKK